MSRLLTAWKQVAAHRPHEEPLGCSEQIAAVIGCVVTFLTLALMVLA